MIHIPDVKTIELSVGVKLRAISTESFKTARLGMYLALPADEDRSPLTTLLRGVLMRGCEKYPSLATLNLALDELFGTTLNVQNFLDGDRHVIGFCAEMLDDKYANFDGVQNLDILGGTMEVIAQMMLYPILESGSFRRDIVESEKQYLRDTILDDINDPRVYAKDRFRVLMCKGEPFGVSLLGRLDQVSAVTPDKLYDHWKYLLQNSIIEVFYIGNEEAENVAGCWKAAFQSLMLARNRQTYKYDSLPHVSNTEVRYINEDKPISQGKLHMGWRYVAEDMDRKDYCSAVVLCEMLGVMQSSLLYTHLREQLGLCYYCTASFEPSKRILSISSGINPNNREKAQNEVLKIIQDLQKGNISSESVHLAKISLQNYICQLSDSQGGMEGFYLGRVLACGDNALETPTDFLDIIMKVTTEDVVLAASRFELDTVYFLNATAAGGEGECD